MTIPFQKSSLAGRKRTGGFSLLGRTAPLWLLISAAAVAPWGEVESSSGGTPGMDRAVFGPGETLSYRVRYGLFETARAKVEIGREDSAERGEIWPITVDAETTRLVGRLYDLDSHFVTRYLPSEERSLGFDRRNTERGGVQTTSVRLDPDANRAVVIREKPGEPPERKVYETGRASHDIASAIFWLRSRPLQDGDVEQVRVFTGRKSWEMVATVMGSENTRTPSGRVRTKRILLRTAFEGQAAAQRDIEVWMTEDDYHIPVAIRADLALGSLRIELLDYEPPSSRSNGRE